MFAIPTNPVAEFIERHAAAITFLVCFGFLYPSMHYAFDVTDAGHHLSKAQVAFSLGVGNLQRGSIHFLTQYLSGAYLALLEWLGLGLWYVRLGWVVLVAGSIAISVKAMQLVFRPHWLWPLAGLAAVANRSAWSKVPDYESVPAMLAAILIFLLLKALTRVTLRMQIFFGGISGVMLMCMMLAKVTTGVMFTLLIVIFAMGSFVLGTLRNAKPVLIGFFGGFATAVIAFFAIIHAEQILHAGIQITTHTNLHSTKDTFIKLFLQLKEFLLLLMFITLVAASSMMLMMRNPFSLPVQYVFGILLIAGYSIFIELGNAFFPYVLATVWGLSFIVTSLFAYPGYFKTYYRSNAFICLSIFGLAMPFVLGLGSYGGFDKLANGAWFSVMCATGCITTIIRHDEARHPKHMLLIFTSIMLLFITHNGYQTFHKYSYGDYGTYDKLTATFETPRLKGIKTQPGRKESVEALLGVIEDHSKPGDALLAYNNMPMIFYASNRWPIFDTPWIISRSEDIFQNIVLKNLCTSADTTPALIVRTKVETRSSTWGNNPDGPEIVEDVIQAKSRQHALDKAAVRCWIKLLWENNDFQVYKTGIKLKPLAKIP